MCPLPDSIITRMGLRPTAQETSKTRVRTWGARQGLGTRRTTHATADQQAEKLQKNTVRDRITGRSVVRAVSPTGDNKKALGDHHQGPLCFSTFQQKNGTRARSPNYGALTGSGTLPPSNSLPHVSPLGAFSAAAFLKASSSLAFNASASPFRLL